MIIIMLMVYQADKFWFNYHNYLTILLYLFIIIYLLLFVIYLSLLFIIIVYLICYI